MVLWPLTKAPTIVVPTIQVRTPEAVQVYTSLSFKQGLLGSADVPYTSELKNMPAIRNNNTRIIRFGKLLFRPETEVFYEV